MTARPYEVHIIESPKAEEILAQRSDRSALRHVLKQAGVPAYEYLVVNKTMFYRALLEVGLRAKAATPIIHFTGHGNTEGVGFTDGSFESWSDLGNIFSELNDALNGNLLLGMSTCEGLHGIDMVAKGQKGPLPFACLVGPHTKVGWQDALVAFVAFYHLVIAKGRDPFEASELMNDAAGIARDSGFCAIRGNTIRAFKEEEERRQVAERFRQAVEHMRGRGLLGTVPGAPDSGDGAQA